MPIHFQHQKEILLIQVIWYLCGQWKATRKKASERLVKEFKKRNGELKKVLNEKKARMMEVFTNKDEEIKKVGNEKKDLQKELEAVNSKMMEEFKNKDDEIKSLLSEKKDLQKELEAVNAKMMEELKNKDDEVNKVLSEKKDLEAVNAIMIKDSRNSREEIKKLSNDKKKVQKELEAVNTKMMEDSSINSEEIKILSNEKKELEAVNTKMMKELKNKDDEVKKVGNEKKELEAVNAQMMEEFKNKGDEIKKVGNERNELQKELECLEAVNAKLNEKYCQQSKEKKGIEKLVEELEKKNEQLKKVLKKRTELLNATNTKYESKYKEAKEQLNEAKKMLKSKQRSDSARKQGCVDCDQKERKLDNLKKLLKNEENKVMELFEEVQRFQLSAPTDLNQGKGKTDVLLSLLPTVNVINQKDLKPVDEMKTPVVIGQGAFGEVSLMRHTPTNSLVAVKTILNGSADNINLEARTMQLCSAHPSFPFMFGVVRDDNNIIQIVSSFIGVDSSSLTLRKAIKSKFVNINRTSILNILLTVSDGVKFLHQNKIAHNDIKAENILLSHESEEWMGKIIDMGGITSPLVEPPAAEVTSSDIFALCFVMCDVAQACHWQQLNELAVRCKKTRPPIADLISLLSKLNI
ncbi:uncharacterized protein [Antedon mediterranea]|uniref:uncharacterized protein isoform X2 n=1 Tax=Antedon mediterranea TaxID=105859 RepID=UPI003AF9D5CB